MRPARFLTLLKVKCEPELQSALVAAAERDHTTVSEFARRTLRAAIRQPSPDRDPPPAGPTAAMPAQAAA